MSHIVLQAHGLQTFYGKSHILHGIDLEVREGEIVTLLGRNGAGKTTTLRSLVGLTGLERDRFRSSAATRRACPRIELPSWASDMSRKDGVSFPT